MGRGEGLFFFLFQPEKILTEVGSSFSSAAAKACLSLSARWKAGGSDPPSSPPEKSTNCNRSTRLRSSVSNLNWNQNWMRRRTSVLHYNKFGKAQWHSALPRCLCVHKAIPLSWMDPCLYLDVWQDFFLQPWPYHSIPQPKKSEKWSENLTMEER